MVASWVFVSSESSKYYRATPALPCDTLLARGSLLRNPALGLMIERYSSGRVSERPGQDGFIRLHFVSDVATLDFNQGMPLSFEEVYLSS